MKPNKGDIPLTHVLIRVIYLLTHKTFPVPRHKTELASGTLHSILKDAGLK